MTDFDDVAVESSGPSKQRERSRVPEQLLWSLAQAAQALGGLSTQTVRRMIDSGELPAVRLPGSLRRDGTRCRPILRVRPEDVKALIERCSQPARDSEAVGSKPTQAQVPGRFGNSPYQKMTQSQIERELDELLGTRKTDRQRKKTLEGQIGLQNRLKLVLLRLALGRAKSGSLTRRAWRLS